MSIKLKLYLIISLICLINLTVAVVSHQGMDKVSSQYGRVTNGVLPDTRQLGELLATYRKIRVELRTLGLMGIDEKSAAQSVVDVTATIKQYEELQAQYLERTQNRSARENELKDEMKREWGEFKKVGVRVLELHEKHTPEAQSEMLKIFLTTCPEHAAAYNKSIDRLIDFQKAEGIRQVKEAETIANDTSFWNITLSVLGILVSFFTGYFYSRKLSQDLDETATTMTTQAKELIEFSIKIANDSDSLSRGVASQSASLQQSVVAVDEISSMITRNAENAMSSQKVSTQSSEYAEQGKIAFSKMRGSVEALRKSTDQISDQVRNGNVEISKIVSVITEIASHTKVINEIAFQTKLLSFNASVEAARAGEHGKGFAVVAEEVGELARRSAQAAKEVSDMLENNVSLVSKIISTTQTEVERMIEVNNSELVLTLANADQCGKALNTLIHGVAETNSYVSEISAASNEQAKGVREVTQAFSGLSQVTEKNSEAASNSAVAAKSLALQADRLNKVIKRLIQIVHGKSAPVQNAKRVQSFLSEGLERSGTRDDAQVAA